MSKWENIAGFNNYEREATHNKLVSNLWAASLLVDMCDRKILRTCRFQMGQGTCPILSFRKG